MSIKNFSKSEFINVVKHILQHDVWINIRNADKMTAESSFREVLDMTSLDIAELIVQLEEKYHVDMEWAETEKIDSIEDVYKTFVQSIFKMRQPKTTTIVKQK